MLTGAGACVGTTAGTARAGRPGGSAAPTRSTWTSTAARPAAPAADTAAGTPARVGTTQHSFCLISTSDQLFSLCGLGQEGAVSAREEQELCQAKVQENLQTVLTWFCCTNNSRLILEEYHRKTLADANNDNFLPVKIYKLSILNCLLVKVTFLLHFLLMKVSAPAVSKNAS